MKLLTLFVAVALSATLVLSSSDYVPTTLGQATGTYTLPDGYTILYVELKAAFEIPYTNEDGNETSSTIYMPSDASCKGEYAGNTQNSTCDQLALVCTFAADNTKPADLWELHMDFTVTDNSGKKTDLCDYSQQDDWDIKYDVSGIGLDFYYTRNVFPDYGIVIPTGQQQIRNASLSLFEISGDSSYKCEHDQTIDIVDTEGVEETSFKITLSDFQAQAFQISSKTDQVEFDTAETCSLDEDGSSLVPIIVGCVLAGLIVITLIAYFIGRWHQNKQGNYQAL